MKTGRVGIRILIAALMVFLLVGCSSGDRQGADQKDAMSTRQERRNKKRNAGSTDRSGTTASEDVDGQSADSVFGYVY